MIKAFRSHPAIWMVLFVPGCLFLNACTQTTAGPSSALKRQFAQMQQNQQQQAEQLQALQQQIEQLLHQSPEALQTAAKTEDSQSNLMPSFTTKPVTIPAAISQEVTALADSASSYLAAFSNLAASRYAVAETGFNNFLDTYPDHQYQPNARYWLANAQLSQGKLLQASSNLRKIVVDLNGQQKAPAALLLLAKVYQQQQLPNEAEEVLEQLRSRYPESSEAQQFFQDAQPQ